MAEIVNPFAETTMLAYDALDRELQKTLANGMTVSHTYDASGRETLLENRKSDGTALAVFTATYDPVGNRLTVLELDGTQVTFTYDPAYQLINEQRSGASAYNTTYTYDGAGNRLTKVDAGLLQTTQYSYNAANELTLILPPLPGLPTTVTWDANGNKAVENAGLLSLTTYTWDPENRLIGVAYPDGTIETHTYSADGMRQKKVTSTGTIVYVRDGENVLIETNASLITQVQYTDFPGIWGGLSSERRSGVSSFYGFDQQDNTRVLVSSGGVVTDSYTYKAFGEELAVSGSTVNPFRFGGEVGYYRDIASRLYVRARHLDVATGRWLSRDRIESLAGAGQNRYEYARNNPLTGLDPQGLMLPPRGTIPDCVKNTKDYWDRYKKTGNSFDKCAANVSGLVCTFVTSCLVRPTALECQLFSGGMLCLNNCLADHYRKRDTPRWHDADRICQQYGECSKLCCDASIQAEQTALTGCESGCGLAGEAFRRWPQRQRIKQAQQLCCPRG